MKRRSILAVAECITENILADFFRENKEEIVEMGIYEFDQEVYDQVLREDGEAIGMKKGEAIGIRKGELQKIEPIYHAAESFAPDYDPDAVFKQIISDAGDK